jgi:hypothetical protein
MNRKTGFCMVFSLLVATGLAPIVHAQAGPATPLITAVDTGAFPEVRVYVAVNDGEANRVPGLAARAFSLTEDGQPITGLTAEEQAVGVQVVFVLDPTDPFGARDVNGVTRLDFIKQALTDFAQTTPWMQDGVDDVTVIAPEGPLITHSRAGADVAGAVMSYTTTFAGAADPFPLMSQALDYAADATARPGMRRYVVFLSNGIAERALNDLAARATASQIPVTTVFVGPAGGEINTSAQMLGRLAELTGGENLLFTGPDTLTPLFAHLADQRTAYVLHYRSGIAVTGQHTLAAGVSLPDGSRQDSNTATFPLRVEPPTVAFENVPAELRLVRSAPGVEPPTSDPATYALQLRVEFPDGHPRAVQPELLVNGERAPAAPDPASAALLWDVTGYGESGTLSLQARVTDELGLSATSAAVTVTLTLEGVAVPASTASAAGAPGRGLLVPVILGLLLLVNVVLGGWLWSSRRGRRRGPIAAGGTAALTQPTRPAQATRPTQPFIPSAPTRPNPRLQLPAVPRLSLPQRPKRAQTRPLGKAYLEVLDPGGGGAARDDIELLGPSVYLGRDASLVEAAFPDRSVSRRHARIVEVREGVFQIFDERSTSGTWVNFTQIPSATGWDLRDGDIINLGRVQLRFRRRNSGQPGRGTTPQN